MTYVIRLFDTHHSASVFEVSHSQLTGLLEGVSREDARAFFRREKSVTNAAGENLWLVRFG